MKLEVGHLPFVPGVTVAALGAHDILLGKRNPLFMSPPLQAESLVTQSTSWKTFPERSQEQ